MKRNGTNRLQVSPPGPDLVPSNFERDLGLARAHMSVGDLCSCSAKQAELSLFALSLSRSLCGWVILVKFIKGRLLFSFDC